MINDATATLDRPWSHKVTSHDICVFLPRPILRKLVPGMDFPVNHETYPNDCENVTCTKIGNRYRPGSWVIITNEWDDSESEFTEFENFVCTECNERNKKSLNRSWIQRRYKAELVLKKEEPVHVAMATSKPLAWVKQNRWRKRKWKPNRL